MNHESTFLVSYELPFMDLYQRSFRFLLITNSTHRYLSIYPSLPLNVEESEYPFDIDEIKLFAPYRCC